MSKSLVLLLVEDELFIRMEAEDALELGGYTVLSAGTGRDALRLLDGRHGELAGVITDIRLGDGPDGWEVARRARELRPDMPVVYVTADGASRWPACGVPKSIVIEKPFVSAQLITAISALLVSGDM